MADDDTQAVDLDEFQGDIIIDDVDGQSYLFDAFADIFARDLTLLEFQYLLNRYPYIDLAKDRMSALVPTQTTCERYRARSGWWICDYGDRLLASPGRLAFGTFAEEGDEGDSGAGEGSLAMQGVQTLEELMQLIMGRWDLVFINDGSYPLQRLIWIMGLDYDFPVDGFAPQTEDHALRERIVFLREGDVKDLLQAPGYSL